MKKITFFLLSSLAFCITCTSQITVTMTVTPPDTVVCDSAIVTFTAHIIGCPGPYVIYWKDGFQYRDTTFSPDSTWVTMLPAGARQIWCTADCNPNGNSSASIINMTVNPCSGIEEYQYGKLLTVYPNPSSGDIIIDADKLMMIPASLSVFDISGRVVKVSYEIKNHMAVLNAKQLESGIYYYRISDKDKEKSAAGKFVISK